MSAAKLLWKPANLSTLKVLRGEFRGQYHIILGRTNKVTDFFSGLAEVVDHRGLQIDVWTEPAPGPDGETPPWRLTVRRMSESSARPLEWYIGSQQPGATHPLWRPGVGPTDTTVPDADRVILLRTADNRFYAGWLRQEQIADLPDSLRSRVEGSRIDVVSAISQTQVGEVLELLGHEPDNEQEPPIEPPEATLLEQEASLTEETAREGQPMVVQHVRRERSRRLRSKKVEAAGERPSCEACGFEFERVYGERGRGFIECHHLIPVSELDPATPTRLEDLALLCANCHRMVHVSRPWLGIDELTHLLASE
jgi:5-methylcytosine-specific restriction endonuclease McrA